MIAIIILLVFLGFGLTLFLNNTHYDACTDLQRQINNMIKNYSYLNEDRDMLLRDLEERITEIEKTLYSLDEAVEISNTTAEEMESLSDQIKKDAADKADQLIEEGKVLLEKLKATEPEVIEESRKEEIL